jgi:hypothetical protein
MHTFTLYHWRNTWLSLRSILANLAMQDELTSLSQWAGKKRLRKVQQAYLQQLNLLQERLWIYQVRNRGLVLLCEFLITAYKQIRSNKKYYRRRSGAQYRVATS